jgi:hypothetical protein
MIAKKRARKKKTSKEQVGLKYGFRSGFEETFMGSLEASSISYSYESTKIKYTQPPVARTYTPDFILKDYNIIIETKGRFTLEDRKKHLWIKEQHPQLDIRFVFMNPKAKIRKGSKTSYADWCIKKGFLYSANTIPPAWLVDKVTNKN